MGNPNRTGSDGGHFRAGTIVAVGLTIVATIAWVVLLVVLARLLLNLFGL